MRHLVNVLGGHAALGVVMVAASAFLLIVFEVLRLSPVSLWQGRSRWWARLAALATLLSLLLIASRFLTVARF